MGGSTVYICVYCTELIEETERPPRLILGMWGYFWPGSGKIETRKLNPICILMIKVW